MKSLKKSLLVLLCGSLVLSAVPARAEFNIQDWFTIRNSLVAAAVAVSCYGMYKLGSWLFGSKTVKPQVLKSVASEKTEVPVVKENPLRINGKQDFHKIMTLEKNDTFILRNNFYAPFPLGGNIMLGLGDFTVTDKLNIGNSIQVSFTRLNSIRTERGGQPFIATFKDNGELVSVKYDSFR